MNGNFLGKKLIFIHNSVLSGCLSEIRQSIALDELYNFAFEFKTISPSVWPQISEKWWESVPSDGKFCDQTLDVMEFYQIRLW